MALFDDLPESLLANLERTARTAGALVLDHYGAVQAFEKVDGSVITEADKAVERFLRRELPLLFEGAYIGEETPRDAAVLKEARRAEWLWIVDPIDGTAAFMDRLDTFCVSIGLFRRGRPYAGLVYFPAVDHCYRASRGRGAECDGRPIHALEAPPIPDRATLYVDARAHLRYRIGYPGKTRSLGSTAFHYLLVARGAAVGALSTARIWDYAGAAAVLLEAGGVLRHLDGSEIDWSNWFAGQRLSPPVLGTAPFFFDEIRGHVTSLETSGCGRCEEQ
ncbi:MAG: hypothetical protein GXP31_03550 [Kiritimatiellaeota bacterium]|nr:hypothetical protein [Kiritimatiellota bacterium]